jgi:uncharacterized protein (DUF2141 family)
MKGALVLLLAVGAIAAQDQTGSIEGVVIDSVSRQPIKRATVSIMLTSYPLGGIVRENAPSRGPHFVITDATGAFSFSDLAAGKYVLTVTHQKYPRAMEQMGGIHKGVQIAAGDDTANVTIQLDPGSAISGKIVDEDGDPLTGCVVQPHPANNPNQGVPARSWIDREDGSFRIYEIPPGKYTVSAHCSQSVFEPRPLSAGPDPPPTAAYPTLFYPAATDVKSAEVIDLAPGSEKSGVDFQMQPVSVTHIHGTMAQGSADWRGRNDLHVELLPLGQRGPGPLIVNGGEQINPKDGSFDIRNVFPGSYRLVVYSYGFSIKGPQSDAPNQLGAMMRVDVADKPVEVSVQLHYAVDISGSVEIEQSNSAAAQLAPDQIGIQLMAGEEFQRAPGGAQVASDGTFTIKSVLPGEWRIQLAAPSAFLKSAWFGTDDVTGKTIDLTSGSASPLRIIVSTNTGTIKGTAPAGQSVFVVPLENTGVERGYAPITGVDSNGQFAMPHLAPGKYCVAIASDIFALGVEQNCQEVTVGEGETVMVDVKPENKP